MTKARQIARKTEVPFDSTFQILSVAAGLSSKEDGKNWAVQLDMYRRKDTFKRLKSGNNTVSRIAYELLASDLIPTESQRYKEAISHRAAERVHGDPEKLWDLIINGKVTVVPDMNLVQAIIYAMIENDIRWAKTHEDQYHLESLRAFQSEVCLFLVKNALLLDPADVISSVQAIFRKSLTSIGIREEFFTAMKHIMDRHKPVPRPHYVVGLCRGFTATRGCPHKSGRTSCKEGHWCLHCGEVTHGWGDCDRLKSLFRGGMGDGRTMDMTERKRLRDQTGRKYGGNRDERPKWDNRSEAEYRRRKYNRGREDRGDRRNRGRSNRGNRSNRE